MSEVTTEPGKRFDRDKPRRQHFWAPYMTQQRECKWYRLCPVKRIYDSGLIARHWITHYCYGNWSQCERFRMEENNRPHSDTMLPDGSYLGADTTAD